MKTLTDLSATPAATPPPLLRVVRAAVHLEPEAGVFLHACLSADGLFLFHGAEGVHLPMRDLIALARLHAPNLQPAKPLDP